jgi:hypothetical protein
MNTGIAATKGRKGATEVSRARHGGTGVIEDMQGRMPTPAPRREKIWPFESQSGR